MEMEKSLKLRCDLGDKKTMTSGTSVQFVHCVAADLKNTASFKNYPDQFDEKFQPSRGSHYEKGSYGIVDKTDLYVALTDPKNTKTRIYKLGSDFEYYDYEESSVAADASFEIKAEEHPFLDTIGLYISTTVESSSDIEHAGDSSGESNLDIEVHLFAGDSYCPVKQWTYKECKMSRSYDEYGETDEDGNNIPLSEYHKKCSITEAKWNGTEIVLNTASSETDTEGDMDDLY